METLIEPSHRVIAFTDLDDTLFASLKEEDNYFHVPATVDANGQPYAYASAQQQTLLSMFVKLGSIIIPVTGRRTDSLLNCLHPDIINAPFSIVSHGAVVLDGKHKLLPEWNQFVEDNFDLLLWKKKLKKLYKKLYTDESSLMDGVRVRLIFDQELITYICIKIQKDNDYPERSEEVRGKLTSLLADGMALHGNGRNFALLPPYASKRLAVNFLRNHMSITSSDTTFGLGDSDSDLPFMSDSDFLIIPNKSQIIERAKQSTLRIQK